TGLRVGVAAAQGLAQGLGIGVLPLTSTAVLAQQAYDAGWDGPVVAVVDARRNEVFCARYGGRAQEGCPPARYLPEVLAAELFADLAADRAARPASSPVRPILAVGNGARRYEALFSAAGVRVAASCDLSPRALVSLAADKLAHGAGPVPPAEVRPVYLREADARINWAHR
ncbi:MAG: tRNA (adenosine(37)-N6)-threonylcarbamoyltransferase complex dimerization subunit type 1 TsaB, partial [Acidimicrobiales bacterium]